MSVFENAISEIAAQADAVGRLAQDTGGFAAVAAAFESRDPDAFAWVLGRLDLLPHCELICDWVAVKFGVLRCHEVCGPIGEERLPDLRRFADAVIRLASDEKLLRRVVDAVACASPEDFREAIERLKLEPFCHLVCRYVVSTIYRRVCRTVCTPGFTPRVDAAQEIRATARVLARMVRDERAFETIARGAIELDCEILRDGFTRGGFLDECEIVCSFICTWRSVYVCRELCYRPTPILTGARGVEEARGFALAARTLAHQPRALYDLIDAVRRHDAKQYAAIVERFGLGAYCQQLCAWIGEVVCSEVCRCVCPQPAQTPLFTFVGHFDVQTDIDQTTGLTNKGLTFPGLYTNGGPGFAFTGALQLSGFCSAVSPITPGVGLKYRFLYDVGAGPQPVVVTMLSPVQVGTRLALWPTDTGGTASAPILALHLPVIVGPAAAATPVAPAIGSAYVAPGTFLLQPDGFGWVTVDPQVDGGNFSNLLGLDTTQLPGLAGGNPLSSGAAIGSPGGVPAGSAVPAANQRTATAVKLTFEATRTTTPEPAGAPDYSQTPVLIRVNNFSEVNNLSLLQFGTPTDFNCCAPINDALDVQYTVDHEQLAAGAWSLSVGGCSPSAPGGITPPLTASRGYSGTIHFDTTTWTNCSYTVTLTSRPGLTNGLIDDQGTPNTVTFCICGH